MKKTNYLLLLAAAAGLAVLAGPVAASNMDSRIELAARQSYVFRSYLQGDDIRVESKEGVVTLTGSVAENSRKSLAQETVAYLPGVISVDNKLEVKGDPTPNSDAWLSDKVKITLLFHRSESVAKAEVEVKDGIVTLRGFATSIAQRGTTNDCVMDVDGVKGVNNEMIVPEGPEKFPWIPGDRIDDASVTAQAKMALLLHRSTRALKISVATRKGVVTVSGKAGSLAEISLVTKVVGDINGVRKVKNKMTAE